MSNIINPDYSVQLTTLSTQELKNELARSLEITARHLQHLANIWRELENRGEDLSHFRHGLMAYLPLIASQQVEPRLVVNYAGQKTLLSVLSQLPLQTQVQLADTGYVTVFSEQQDDKKEIQVPLNSLSVSDIHSVFDIERKKIRSPEEQAEIHKKIDTTPPKARPVTRIVGFDRRGETDLLVVSGKRVPVRTVLTALAEKYPDHKKELENLIERLALY